jgi:hypothetical protein
MATAAACADQAQIFCAVDFDSEANWRRGLVSGYRGRARPSLASFQFMQRLLDDVAQISLWPSGEPGMPGHGLTEVRVERRDGLSARVVWTEPAPAAGGPGRPEPPQPPVPVTVPPFTFVADSRGQLLEPPRREPYALLLPPATTPEAGGAVRVLI